MKRKLFTKSNLFDSIVNENECCVLAYEFYGKSSILISFMIKLSYVIRIEFN